MTEPSPPLAGITRAGFFGNFYQRFDELLAESNTLSLYFIHSRRWRENHDAGIKALLRRPSAKLEVFLPDLENHELMFSLGRHFEDGSLIPTLVVDAYRYFGRLARDFGQPSEIRLYGRYPTFSFYQFKQSAVVAWYSNAAAKKEAPAFEVLNDSPFGAFLAADLADLRKECRLLFPSEIESVIEQVPAPPAWGSVDTSFE